MSRYIDADALLYDLEIVPLTDDGGVDANDLDDIIKRQPTIEVKRGKWIYPNDTQLYATCSNCKEELYQAIEYKFCPNCGSDNRGEEDGKDTTN